MVGAGVAILDNRGFSRLDGGDIRYDDATNGAASVGIGFSNPGLLGSSELQRWEEQKAEFMRAMVHELRSPAAASKSLVAALRYKNRENLDLAAILVRVEERMDQLLGLVEDILYLSKIKTGQPLGEVIICDLAAETRFNCKTHLDEAEAKGLKMTIDLPESPIYVRIDRQGYRLILSNLISNAIKYTPAGSVQVALRQAECYAVLEVRDTGIGIPKDDIPKLFEEFFRASNARRNQIQGTGVGLAAVKSLVERLGGGLEVASEENIGSRFTVRLPLCKGMRLDRSLTGEPHTKE
jgi:signal transduction histidine kinase